MSGRVDAGEYAHRINTAVELLESGVAVGQAAQILAQRFGCSTRQARRYAEHAVKEGPVAAREPTTVFTVKLPVALAARVRGRAQELGSTISALVAQALTEFLARGGRKGLRK
jgi:hypothetical protein